MSTGGEINIIAYEVRGLLYLILGYLLVVNLLKSPAQVKGLFWVLLLGIALKGVLGSWRYAVTLNGDLSRTSILSTTNSLMAHEESYMFVLFFAFIAVAWLLRTDRTQLLFAVALVLPVALSFLANQRRASVLVLLLALLIIAALVYVTTRWRRGLIAVVAVAGLVVLPLYVVSLSGSEGLIAEPASAFASVYRPDERDQSSNRYRDLENENLRLNIANHPLLGDGFGKPIPLYVPVPDLSEISSLWAYIPHNTVLWVWHRLGFVGFVAFWFLAGRLVVTGFHSAKSLNDPYFKLVAVMSVVAVTGWIVLGLLDQGFASFRPSLLVGLMAGLLSVMPRLETAPRKAADRDAVEGRAASVSQRVGGTS
jgi:O-antigen ligase